MKLVRSKIDLQSISRAKDEADISFRQTGFDQNNNKL